MVQCQVAQHTGLDLHLLDIHLPLDLVAGLKFDVREHTCLGKHLHHLGRQVGIDDARHRCLAVQTAPLGLVLPLGTVAIAVEVHCTRLP